MFLLRRIKAALAFPLTAIKLITEYSGISESRQRQLEAETERSLGESFAPVFRFAIASDVHISLKDDTTAKRLENFFESAYRYSDSHPSYNPLDAILFAGDNCDRGEDGEYEIFRRIVKENLREGTKLITVMGNHEFTSTGLEGYERHMGEPRDKHEVVKGFHFIGMSPCPTDTWHTPAQLLWLRRELCKAEKAAPDKPIFTMQHGHILHTVYVSRSWRTQMSLPLHSVYSIFPQVINFSGHSHGPVNNPLEIWQNNYTLLGTGTLNYFEMENDIGDDTVPEGSRNAAQYLIVEVDGRNRVRIKPYNLLTDGFMKTTSDTDEPGKPLMWQIDDVFDKKRYAYTSARRKTATIPFFDKEARLSVQKAEDGKTSVTFDRAKDGVCVYGYRIVFYNKKAPAKAVLTKEIYSGYYFEPIPDTLTCTVDSPAAGEYTVKVFPLNVWLTSGEPISTETVI